MSFFGLHNHDAIERDREAFLNGTSTADEDIAVYNWGSEDYDGLGNVLQEGGDDLNDETFGGTGPVGALDLLSNPEQLVDDLHGHRQGLRLHRDYSART